MARVSVVVPNYNYGRFLAARLRSVLDQGFRDVEVIYLDDCSTDDSEAVLAGFLGDPRLRAVRNERNSGNAFGQINKGLSLARGEYVWVAQADDRSTPDFLERLVDVLDRHPSVGMAYCQSLAIDEHDRELFSLARRTRDLDPERWEHDYVNAGRDECLRYLLLKNTIPNISAVVFRREVLERIGGVDQSFRLSPDWVTYLDVLAVSDIAYVARPMNLFRRHTGSIRRRSKREGLQVEEGYRVLEHARERLGLSEAEMEPARDRLAAAWVRKMLRPSQRLPLDAARRIWPLARELDPHVGRRLARELLLGWTRVFRR